MKKYELTFPEIWFLAFTHLVFGAGLALLASGKLRDKRRKGIGAALTAIAVATGPPRIMILLRGRRREKHEHDVQLSTADERAIQDFGAV